MHLLAAEAQRIDDGQEAVDLALAPAPIVILSAADSEIAAFNEAVKRWDGPEVRLASLSALTHPMSVDMLAAQTLRAAKVVAVRLLGGEGYFAYGVEVLRRLALGGGPALMLVPGEAAYDAQLAARGTVDAPIAEAFHALCREGGPLNRERALTLLAHLVDGRALPPPAATLPAAGPYLPQGADTWPDGPGVGVVFYRSHLMDGLTGGVDAVCTALAAAGLR
ncbi:MAG: cobaltochelatase subunit CobN, partial [Pseudomonadota bacterium]